MSSLPFIHAFLGSHSAAGLGDVVIAHARTDRDAVDLEFPQTFGALEGHADAKGLSVAAIMDGECWDFVYDDDLLTQRGDGGWVCGLCPEGDRPSYTSPEVLWRHHLLDLFAAWCRNRLRRRRAFPSMAMKG